MTTHLSIAEAKNLVSKVLEKQGYTAEEIILMSEVILFGSLRESSQGMNKLFGWHAEKAKDAQEPSITSVTDIISKCDARRNSGMYANTLAVEHLLTQVAPHGMALIGVNNFNSSSGALSFYTKKIAEQKLVGIMLASADPIGGIGLPGSKVGVFGTNPLAISIPYQNTDLTLDMSTAKYTWGDLVNAKIQNQELAPGFAFDSEGNPTTDPTQAMSGTVNAFDGSYKGFGLAFMIQILAGALVGSMYAQSDELCDYGSLIMAIDPERLGGQSFMEQQISKMIEAVKANPQQQLFLPGEKSNARYQLNLNNNQVPVDEELLTKIKQFIS